MRENPYAQLVIGIFFFEAVDKQFQPWCLSLDEVRSWLWQIKGDISLIFQVLVKGGNISTNLTWNLKMAPWKRISRLTAIIFRFQPLNFGGVAYISGCESEAGQRGIPKAKNCSMSSSC